MYILVLVELAGELHAEAAIIGPMLGLAAYDVTARISGGLPRILLQSHSDEEARQVYASLTARGHGVVLCDKRDVVTAEQMVQVRRFECDDRGLWAHGRSGDYLPFEDLGAAIVAGVRTPVVRLTKEPVGRGDATMMVEHTSNEHAQRSVVYLFPHVRAKTRVPWLLDEHAAHYMALGKRLKPTQSLNFLATVDLLRDNAPDAIFDERLVAAPRVLDRLVHVRDTETAIPLGSDASLEVTVHALARWLMHSNGAGPYRG